MELKLKRYTSLYESRGPYVILELIVSTYEGTLKEDILDVKGYVPKDLIESIEDILEELKEQNRQVDEKYKKNKTENKKENETENN